MFVLITGEYEAIDGATKVELFVTRKEAHDAMVSDAMKRAWDEGVPDDELDDFIDELDDNGGAIYEVVGWQIREIPGAYIPQTVCDTFREYFDDASRMYADDERGDWFDADDNCRDACGLVSPYIHGIKKKVCPNCGTELFDDMRVCFNCLHEFKE